MNNESMFIVDKICLATHDLGSKGVIYITYISNIQCISYLDTIYTIYMYWTSYELSP